jgi:hypothetical protein
MFKTIPWELVEENKRMQESIPDLVGLITHTYFRTIYVDVYRKKRRNGIYKYKYVKRMTEL